MLILNFLRLKNNTNNLNLNSKFKEKGLKFYPSSTREWNNSVYNFNKNNTYLVPISSSLALQIIKVYFTLFNFLLESKLRTKRLLYRFRRLSSNRIFVSNGKFKHTNNKVIITLYIFNRQKNNYLLTISKWFKKITRPKFSKLISKVVDINCKKLDNINKKRFLLSDINLKVKGFDNISRYINSFHEKLIQKSLIKLQLYIYYKQLIYLNTSKYNFNFLQFLIKHLELIFNKDIEINLVNINKFYLNSDIVSESIKLKIIRNKSKFLKYISLLKSKINIVKRSLLQNKSMKNKNVKFMSHSTYLKNYVFNNLKYKRVSGFRLEARGRLTKRNAASRALSKNIYKGSLLNIDSSYRGISSVLLKGNLNSNMQLTKMNSKSRLGSFGLKTKMSAN